MSAGSLVTSCKAAFAAAPNALPVSLRRCSRATFRCVSRNRGEFKQTSQKFHRVNKKLTSGADTDVFAPRHLTHVKQRKTPQNQVQNYGSKLRVQNPPRHW